jgi:hydroxylamine reductase
MPGMRRISGKRILFTTNGIVPPRSEEVRSRIFTTGTAGYPGCIHISPEPDEKKDFLRIASFAKTLPAPQEVETGMITGGFAHNQVSVLADKIAGAVKSGAVKKFFVMAGCDGRMKSRA